MATVRAQPLAESADSSGVSVVTSTRSAAELRRGLIYNPTTLAACTPVHFHPLSPGRFLMLCSRRWYAADMSESEPGLMTGHSVDTAPGWVIVDGAGGQTPPNGSYTIHPDLLGTTLAAATSLASTYLFTLSHGDTGGVVAHFRYSPDRDMMLPLALEHIPPLLSAADKTVHFNRGIYIDGTMLVVLGADDTGALYQIRKPFGRVGASEVIAKGGRSSADSIDDPTWHFYTGTGWSHTSSELAPMGLVSLGPVSVATFRERRHIATVQAGADDARYARVYSRRPGVGVWTIDGLPVPLGVDGQTYLGGTLQFQQQIPADSLAVPYLTSVLQLIELPPVEDEEELEEGEEAEPVYGERIHVSWDTWPVVR